MTKSSHFTVEEVLRESWSITKRAWPKYLLLFLGVIVLYFGFQVIYRLLAYQVFDLTDAFYLSWIVHFILTILLTSYLAIIVARTSLLVARNKAVDVNEVLKVQPATLANAMLGAILFNLIKAIGFILLVIPGIIASVMFPFYIFSILDKGTNAVQSLEDSMRMTDGNKLTIFLSFLMIGLLAALAMFVPMAMLFGGVMAVGGEAQLMDSFQSSPQIWIVVLLTLVVAMLVVGTIANMMSISSMAYMYLRMRQHTPVNSK